MLDWTPSVAGAVYNVYGSSGAGELVLLVRGTAATVADVPGAYLEYAVAATSVDGESPLTFASWAIQSDCLTLYVSTPPGVTLGKCIPDVNPHGFRSPLSPSLLG